VFRLVPQHPRPHTAVRRSAAALAGLALAGSTLVATAPAESLTPYHGGWGIARQTSTTTAVACTDGFHGRDTDGRSVLLTAGHCGAAGSVWKAEKDWRRIGVTSRRTFRQDDSADDWSVVRSSATYALGPTVIDRGKVKYVLRLGSPSRGMAVCTTGRLSGTRCGHVTRVKANGIVVTDIVTHHGDSGAPLFRRIAGSNRVAALGILSYGDEATYSAFQRLSEVLRRTGVRLKHV
jgi:streptogrisin D